MRLFNCADPQNRMGRILAPFSVRSTRLLYFSTIFVPGKGKNELLSRILCPAGRAEPPAYQGSRFFFGSVVGSYLGAERSFVCVQELVRVFSPCRRLAYLLFSTLFQKDTGWRSVPRSTRSITHGRK